MTETTQYLDQIPCTHLKGVGPKIITYLNKLNIYTISDLLFHLPLRYEDRSQFKLLRELRVGDHVQVKGEIITTTVQHNRRKSLICRIKDETGFLVLRFFYFNNSQFEILNKLGQNIQCYGEVRRGPTGFEMIHPEFQVVGKQEEVVINKHLTPIYSTTEGLNQFTLRKLTKQALTMLQSSCQLRECLPEGLLKQFSLDNLNKAIIYVHTPPLDAEQNLLQQGFHPTQQRLVFEELLAHQVSLTQIRMRAKKLAAFSIDTANSLVSAFIQQLPFQLTQAQMRVIEEIKSDLRKAQPMLRLVQGDVGSGKTIVAAIVALFVVQTGYQVAVMAPTELLAQQHLHNFKSWFENFPIRIGMLTGALQGKARQSLLNELQMGEVNIVIGTHALFQKEVLFSKLALVIIDEQHRFGVHQRLSLLEKGATLEKYPHQLIMTATPIPRTLAMTAYADLDCSMIDEYPPGRTPITTLILPNSRRSSLIERLRNHCAQKQQAYWVCTLIQESEVLQCQAAQETAQELKALLPELRIGLVHGQIKTKEKEDIMLAFKAHEIDLLVATTVIEVGVDVSNATLMVIENPERLGLAQLHQLRGRVGRGHLKSYTVLMYQHPLSHRAKERLSVLRDHDDGFIIAQKDLELRGPGEVLGTKQTGLMQLKIADLLRDKDQLTRVSEAARILLENYPDAVESLILRWLSYNSRYSDV